MFRRRLAKLSSCAVRWVTLSLAETSGGAGGSGLLIDDSDDRRGFVLTAAPDPGTADVLSVLFEAVESGLEFKALRIANGASEMERKCSGLDNVSSEGERDEVGDCMPIAGELSMEVTPPTVVAYLVMLNREAGCAQASPRW